jgi:DNA adenine methylase
MTIPCLFTRHASTGAQLTRFPGSRYMGSKQAILPFIHDVVKELEFTTVLDACSGSGAVSYLFKAMDKSVISNDFLRFCFHIAQACVANNTEHLEQAEVEHLLSPHPHPQDFIARTFHGLYFTDAENELLDTIVAHILEIPSPLKQSLAFASLTHACLRRRPRGIFTYTGVRYDDGRRDLRTPLAQHFRDAVSLFNASVFDNGRSNTAINCDIFDLPSHIHVNLVYIDPPYVSPHSDNDYTRRYHFVEGLTRYWSDVKILEHTKTKKFQRIPSPFDSKTTILPAFHKLFERFEESIIVVSYSSNGIPSKEELLDILRMYKPKVSIYECDHRYSFGTHNHKIGNAQNEVKEYLFVGR